METADSATSAEIRYVRLYSIEMWHRKERKGYAAGFSEPSRSELWCLVPQVENEKFSDFTDWFDDR